MDAKSCAAALRHAAEFLEQHPDIEVCGYINGTFASRAVLNIRHPSFESVAGDFAVSFGRHDHFFDYAKFDLPTGDVEVFTLYKRNEPCPYRPAAVA